MTILFIDDDSDDTELFCEAVNYLASSDFLARMPEPIKCVSCNHSYTAVELLKNLEELPAYIFLDINMPVMDGKECLIKLKSDPISSNVPVIMLSTTLRSGDVQKFKALGAVDCIIKPSGFNEVIKILSKYVYNL